MAVLSDLMRDPVDIVVALAAERHAKKWSAICKLCGRGDLMASDRYDGIWRLYENERVEGNRYKVHPCRPKTVACFDVDDFEVLP